MLHNGMRLLLLQGSLLLASSRGAPGSGHPSHLVDFTIIHSYVRTYAHFVRHPLCRYVIFTT